MVVVLHHTCYKPSKIILVLVCCCCFDVACGEKMYSNVNRQSTQACSALSTELPIAHPIHRTHRAQVAHHRMHQAQHSKVHETDTKCIKHDLNNPNFKPNTRTPNARAQNAHQTQTKRTPNAHQRAPNIRPARK